MKQIIKIGLIILMLDAIVNAIPAAYTLYSNNDYLPAHEQGPIKNFFKSLGLHSILYMFMVSPIHLGLVVLYSALIRTMKQTAPVCVLLGLSLALGTYLIYAYNYSLDWSLAYFPFRIAWYAVLGSLFGLLYFKYVKVDLFGFPRK